ncbi:MAG: hypothetical protein AAGH65_04770 [Pseudomonadota bacterium]
MNSLKADFLLLQDFMQRLPSPAALVWMMLGLLLGWWMYVPIHELLHVLGVVWPGGEATRLELSPIYGADWLARVFPFVVSGSDYAGQLTGFDTNGSDWIYQSCVLMPFVLTVFPGFWLWQKTLSAPGQPGVGRTMLAGAGFVLVAAPLVSLTGDYYESGSIIGSQLLAEPMGRELQDWRSDDLFRLIGEWPGELTGGDILGIGLSAVLSVVLALVTMWLGSTLGRALGAIHPDHASRSPTSPTAPAQSAPQSFEDPS